MNRILIVEDEPTIGELCQRILGDEGFEVDVARNGEFAQEMVERQRYALCLIDIRLPAMDGKELYQWIKEKHPGIAGRVIFTSGDIISGDIQSFLEKARRPFLPKPFANDELIAIVTEVLEQATTRK